MTTSRNRRRVIALAALVLAASGCSSDEQPADPDPSPTAETTSEPLPCVPGTEPFTGPAADTFGAEEVMDAYCMLAELVEEQERTSLALPVPEQEIQDVDRLLRLVTRDVAEKWPDWVRGRRGSNRSPIDGLTLHDVRRPPAGYRRADDGPYVFGTRVGPATAELARGGEALSLSFTMDTGLVLEEKGDDTGRHSLLPVTRRGTYVLVPVDGGDWNVDEWQASFEHGDVRLVSG